MIFVGILVGCLLSYIYFNRQLNNKIKAIRKDASNRSRYVHAGKMAENLAPFLPDFPFDPETCRFLGNPIDIISFEPIPDTKDIKITFVEIKSGDSKLTKIQRQIRNAIDKHNIYWKEYRVPKGITSYGE